jgi:hypothetical protein
MPNEALREIERVGYVDKHIAYFRAASRHNPLTTFPLLGPVDKGVAAVGRGYHRVRNAFRKCAPAADRAISLG